MSGVTEFKISLDAKFSDIIVPTMDTVRSTYILELLLCCQKTVHIFSFFCYVMTSFPPSPLVPLYCEKARGE